MRNQGALLTVQLLLIVVLGGIVAALLFLPPERRSVAVVLGADPAAAPGPEEAVSAKRVAEALQSRPDLIPYEPVLGGSMGFYDAEEIHVLSDDYVFARFTDGHVQGAMVLEYQLNSSGSIRWRVLSATLDR